MGEVIKLPVKTTPLIRDKFIQLKNQVLKYKSMYLLRIVSTCVITNFNDEKITATRRWHQGKYKWMLFSQKTSSFYSTHDNLIDDLLKNIHDLLERKKNV